MLVSNPREWAKAAVGSWWRFGFMAVCLIGIQVQVVVAAMDGSLRSGLISAAIPTMFQLMFLYVLRRLYRQLAGQETTATIAISAGK